MTKIMISMSRENEIVGACLSQFHDDEDSFELLLSYADGREIGHVVSRATGKEIGAEFASTFPRENPTPSNMIGGGGSIPDGRAVARGCGAVSNGLAPPFGGGGGGGATIHQRAGGIGENPTPVSSLGARP